MIIVNVNKLTERMAKAGFTGAGLARATKITQGYMCQIVNGKRSVLPPTAKKLCDALSCEFDDVFEIKRNEDGSVSD